MSSQDFLIDQDGKTTILTFNRPDSRNAMTWEMYEAVYDICERIEHDPNVRVLVLRGAGERSFVSGTDIRQFKSFKTREDALGYEARLGRILGRLSDLNKPTIAMVNGDAIGGGLFLALAADLRLSAEQARFGVPVARTLGNFPAASNYSRLVAAIGPIRYRELMLTARLLNSAEAKSIGLIDQVHSAADLEARTLELAANLANLAPLTLAAAKEATRRITALTALTDAEDLVLSCNLSADFQEGVSAFLEKRKPNWQGK